MDVISRLVEALRCLPGVGPKSAQRMVYHLLKSHRQRGLHLAECLEEAMQTVRHCGRCNNHTTADLCPICLNQSRDSSVLCVVETPSDMFAIEQSHSYRGTYFVLMGKLSPIDGIGPSDIYLPKLKSLIHSENIQEVILALSPTIEGQATLHVILEMFQGTSIKFTQPAHGIPSGGELEYLDSHTISKALLNRSTLGHFA